MWTVNTIKQPLADLKYLNTSTNLSKLPKILTIFIYDGSKFLSLDYDLDTDGSGSGHVPYDFEHFLYGDKLLSLSLLWAGNSHIPRDPLQPSISLGEY